ncbi:MAG: ribosome biogenesis GTP-binding protein YihA/YsxC [Deferribacteraceae bacterium]|jgi:GTP-binding protein|nr:ribosome biogenesis GTP-binding protein YihA/YsxC [Deferribacteraceae bacterium]
MKSNFLMSVANVRALPAPMYPEIAFAGRSNVGKSSLINKILDRKNLVKTGKTPGKTKLLNFFNVGGEMVFVDLPGYGYAAVSKAEKAQWAKLIDGYLRKRKNLVMCFILVDIRRGVEEEEAMLLQLLHEYNISACVVLTKSDKLSNNQLMNQKHKIAKEIGANFEDLIHFSTVTGDGKDKIRKAICETVGIAWD